MMISIHSSIKQALPKCRLGYIIIKNVTIGGIPSPLSQEFCQLQAEVAKAYNLDALMRIPRIMAVRGMFKKLEFDPSRYRPSSEALVRRVLQKKGLYYINSAVDVNNYCSLKFLLPFGLYDLNKISGNIQYALAPQGTYENIAGHYVSTSGKPFLMDADGVFGNPVSDSRRTAVTLATRDLLNVIYVDEEISAHELEKIMDFTAEKHVQYNGGIIAARGIVQ